MDHQPPWDDGYSHRDEEAPDAPPAPNKKSASGAASPDAKRQIQTHWPQLNAAAIFGALEPVKYLLEAFDICPGAPTLIAGAGFTAKTVALQSAALSIAAGLKVWGQFSARAGRVLHVDYEQGAHLTRKKYQRLAASMMIGPDDVADRLVLVSMPQ